MIGQVEAALARLAEQPAFLTFSRQRGADAAPRRSRRSWTASSALRDRLAPNARTAILSNSTRLGEPAVFAALRRLDTRIMKLDAGTQAVLGAFNQPLEPLAVGDVVDGLSALGDVTIQALFAAGPRGQPQRGQRGRVDRAGRAHPPGGRAGLHARPWVPQPRHRAGSTGVPGGRSLAPLRQRGLPATAF
ncbi:MAG: hypothetical protein AB2L07_14990 [Thermoanaerobaculaceae bacterium]